MNEQLPRTGYDFARIEGLRRIAWLALAGHAIGIPVTFIQGGVNSATLAMVLMTFGYVGTLWMASRRPLGLLAKHTISTLFLEVLLLTGATGGIESALLPLLAVIPVLGLAAGGPALAKGTFGAATLALATLVALHLADITYPLPYDLVVTGGAAPAWLAAMAMVGVSVIWLSSLQRLQQVELNAAIRAAKQAALDNEQFLAISGHELRTPMNGVVGMLLLLRESDLTPTQTQWVRTAIASADSMMGQVDTLLNHAAGPAQHVSVKPRPFRLDSTLRETSHLISALHGVRIAVRNAPKVTLFGDDRRLRQILLNLLDNAVRYAGEALITVDATWSDNDLAVHVTDRGRGMSPADLERVFRPMDRLDPEDCSTTGLGLGISRALARAMGGDLNLVSALERGTAATVRVRMPRADEDLDSGPHIYRRALVVDDNVINRKVISAALARLNVEVQAVDSGQEAIKRAAETDFDLVVSDLRMPEMDGYATREQLASMQPGLAFVAISSDVGAKETALTTGFDAFLPKPLDLRDLQRTLEQIDA